MKRSLTLLGLAFLTTAANATYCPDGSLIESHPNNDCNYKPPVVTTPAPAPVPVSSSASAAAKASAGASAAQKQAQQQQQAQKNTSANTNTNTATTGPSTASAAGGANSLGPISAGNDSSSTSFRALALSLPSPVFTPPMPISTCPQANVDQHAVAVGWNFFSQASSHLNADNCTTIIIYNAFLAQCKYASAQKVLNSMMVKMLPSFEPESVIHLDLTTKECRDLQAPLVFAAPAAGNYLYTPPVCSAPRAAPVAKGKKTKRSVYKEKNKC